MYLFSKCLRNCTKVIRADGSNGPSGKNLIIPRAVCNQLQLLPTFRRRLLESKFSDGLQEHSNGAILRVLRIHFTVGKSSPLEATLGSNRPSGKTVHVHVHSGWVHTRMANGERALKKRKIQGHLRMQHLPNTISHVLCMM